jgi:uroporphyrinogen-III decarboxylase
MTNQDSKYSTFQKGYKMAADAMNGKAERVPIFAQIGELMPAESGKSATSIFRDPELLSVSSFEICKKYGIDVPVVAFDTYNIESEAIGQRLKYHDEIMPDIDRTHHLIMNKNDLDKIKTPDFERDGRCSFVANVYRTVRKLTGNLPGIVFCAPFSMAANIRGIEKLILDICRDQDFARDLFERITEKVLIPWIKFLHSLFPDTPRISGADALASLPIINEKILDEWAVHYIERIREVCGPKVCVPNHTGERYSKNPENILDIRLRANPLYIQGQDPDLEILGAEFYTKYALKHNLPLLMGLGAVFLAQSSPKEVHDRVKEYVRKGRENNGRLWFYLCNLEPGTPVDNIKAAVGAVHEYGTY